MFQLESSLEVMNIISVLLRRRSVHHVPASLGQPQLGPRPGSAPRLMARARETRKPSSVATELPRNNILTSIFPAHP
jgi:hypothetical protein